ncbi:putative protein YbbN [BD1-7 clade bacterium]|uniref:Thioredoxin domain-containing protein n=1 Tax=BD1-7 clade bacterium TaxID=2029982 RepID=A0A5S9QB95_9GAMM|nr:putative protein YbbN [BD1-7 clade bacterium]
MNPLDPALNAAPAADVVVDIDQNNAQAVLIEESQQRPVVAVFWSPRAPESLQIVQALEQVATEYQGDFLLARVNADELSMIAQQLGVRGLPTVMLLKDGQPVDGFAGAQDDAGIRAMLDPYLPKPWDRQFAAAQGLVAAEDYAGAIAELQPAYADSGQRPDIGKLLAFCLVHQHRVDDADAIIQTIPMAEQDGLYEQVVSQIELKRSAAQSPELTALQEKLQRSPDDMALQLQLAVQYHEVFENRKACELLIGILRKDRGFDDGGAKRILLDIFKSLGNKDPLVIEFQRQMFSLLY